MLVWEAKFDHRDLRKDLMSKRKHNRRKQMKNIMEDNSMEDNS